MADERLKVEMLRFVDVFPTLRSRREISRHLREYFARQGVATPKVLRWGISLAGNRSPVAPLASGVIKRQMKGFAQRFIVGRDARSAIPALKALRDRGTGFTLDVLGEASVSEAEAHAYQLTYLALLDGLAATAAAWPPQSVVDDGAWGPLPRVNLSLKITSLYSQIDPLDFDGSVDGGQGPSAPHLPQGHPDGRRPHPRPRAVPLPRPHARACSRRCSTKRSSAATTTPASCCRPICATPTATSTSFSPGRTNASACSTCALVKGAYWDYETVHRRPGGLAGARVHAQARHRRDVREADARDARTTPGTSGRRSPATTCVRWPRPSRRRASSGSRTTPSRSRCCTAWASPSSRPFAAWACGFASTPRSASSSPAWPTWCGGCSRTPPTTPFCGRRSSKAPPWRSSSRPRRPRRTSAPSPPGFPSSRRPTPTSHGRSPTSRTPTSRAARTVRPTTRRSRRCAAASARTTRCASAAATSRPRRPWRR